MADKKFETMIKTELQALNMLAKKHSNESELASYVFVMTGKMMNDIVENNILNKGD